MQWHLFYVCVAWECELKKGRNCILFIFVFLNIITELNDAEFKLLKIETWVTIHG